MKTAAPTEKRSFIQGQPALLVIDIQGDLFIDHSEEAIPCMEGFDERVAGSARLIEAVREAGVPVIFIQEVHRPNGVDFGRELDGAEEVHCLENDPQSEVNTAVLGFKPGEDYLIKKRRYSAFFGTDLEILLKGLKIDTLILCGCLTDVCVHYTFVDGHQHDYYCRVVEDCVAGSSLAAHEASLNAMEYLQADARCTLEGTITQLKNLKV
ncbi:cysteine hydrolase [Pontiellaceae bacterium B12227]|nr:cysteine hydrolase [Pontiellaceae bacterium B12227]